MVVAGRREAAGAEVGGRGTPEGPEEGADAVKCSWKRRMEPKSLVALFDVVTGLTSLGTGRPGRLERWEAEC